VKIVFLMKNRPDYVQRIPDDVDWMEMVPDDKGVYREEDLKRVADADAVILSHQPVNEQLLEAIPTLKMVQCPGRGFDTIDLEACARRGIPVCNQTDINKDALAEHGMALLLALTRRLVETHGHLKQVDWLAARAHLDDTYDLKGKTLGIVGFGKSGYELARRAVAFGMRILYNNRSQVDARFTEAVGAEYREKDDLYRESDVVSLNVTLNPSTQNMVGARELALMKPGSYLINVTRGGMIDEQALADALNSDRLAGSGMDVFSIEPIRPDNPLLKAKNVVLTAHAAGTTKECTDREILWGVENIRRYVERGQRPNNIINGVEM
jgi:lactate dehydrogenase-like 2-hydroxyacid dehydrogenase